MSEDDPKFASQAEAVFDAMERIIADGGGTLTVCVGELCPLGPDQTSDEYVAYQEAGCPKCQRITLEGDGAYSVSSKAAN